MSRPTITWKNDQVELIDQRKLPQKCETMVCTDIQSLWQAIRQLSVRGAPALGVAAGFGVLLGAEAFKGKEREAFVQHVNAVADYLATSRPTAVNLFNVLDQMRAVLNVEGHKTVVRLKAALKEEALRVYEEDRQVCRRMGAFGAALIPNGARVMTICNAGALATVDYGTALGVMYSAKEQGKKFEVYACETRPLLQGARLTSWELLRAGITTTLICDNMAATLMKQGKVDIIFAGADRIAANGDTANKIGTYNLAVLAQYHDVPFHIVAPRSTFDLTTESGEGIPIEERSADEVKGFGGVVTAPKTVKVYNPAFDVTDAKLIRSIVTEVGCLEPVNKDVIQKAFEGYSG